MPAFTSILLAVSTAAAVAGVSNAKKAAAAQKKAQQAQAAAAKAALTKSKEAGLLEAQDPGDLAAKTVLGSSAVSKELLPEAAAAGPAGTGVGGAIGGLGKSKDKIGGL